MRPRRVCLLTLVALQVLWIAPGLTKESKNWPLYCGNWFCINYPPHFKARVSMRSLTARPGYDSAFFVSPDRTVEFYVFSPQWDGKPTDIRLNPKKEKLVSARTRTEKWRRTTWQTIRARDNSYRRSFVDIRETSEAPKGFRRRVFGIKYSTQKAYKRYQDKYLIFQRSLEQFGD